MKNSIKKEAFSLIIWMGLVLVMSIASYYIIEFVIPFSWNVRWIENSINAYYQAENGIEDALLLKKNNSDVWYETWKLFDSNSKIDYKYTITASWTKLPPDWEWNSDFDKNWDKIQTLYPIQLEIWKNKILDFSNFKLYFRVPNINNNSWLSPLTLSWWANPIINWQLVSEGDTLYASWSQILADDILKSDGNNDWIAEVFSVWGWHSDGINISWFWYELINFYNSNCSINWCILKLSIIDDLILKDSPNTTIPYLEWVIINSNSIPLPLPLRHSYISSSWKSYWFKKSLKISIPQQTINEWLDFTVFQ